MAGTKLKIRKSTKISPLKGSGTIVIGLVNHQLTSFTNDPQEAYTIAKTMERIILEQYQLELMAPYINPEFDD